MAEEVLAKGTLELDVVVNQNAVNRAANEIAKSLQDKLGGAVSALEQRIGRGLGDAVKATTKTLAAMGTVGATALATALTKSIQLGASFNTLQQQARAALGTILGIKEAEKLLTRVNTLVDDSPFSRENFIAATQQLIGFGVAAQNVVPILNAIQQAVAGIGGSSQDVQEFANIFAQITSLGRITGQELQRFSARGIDAAQLIGDELGKTGEQIKEEISKGAIDADTAIDALTKGMIKKFGGATDALRLQFTGSVDKMRAASRDLGAFLASAFIDPKGGGALVDTFNNLSKVIRRITQLLAPLQDVLKDVGGIMVDLSERALEFVRSINVASVARFIDTMRDLAPVIAAVAVGLAAAAGNLAGFIPIIGPVLAAINPFAAAFLVLGVTVPEVRQQFVAIGKTLIATLKPAFDAIVKALPSIMESFSALATAVGPALVSVIQILGPLLAVAANALHLLAAAIAPLLRFAPINALLSIFIARLIILKTFGGLGTLFQKLAVSIVGLGRAGEFAGEKLFGMGESLQNLGKLGTIGITAFITGFTLMSQAISAADARAKALAATITDGLTLDSVENLNLAYQRGNDLIEQQKQKIREQTGLQKVLNFFTHENEKNLMEINNLQGDIAQRQNFITGVTERVAKATGESAAQVTERLKAAGVDLTSIPFDQYNATIQKNAASFFNATDAANGYAASVEKINQITNEALGEFNALFNSVKAVESAQKSLAASNQAEADAAQRVRDLQADRAKILRETITPLKEVANAERDLVRARIQLADIDETILDTQEALNRLRDAGLIAEDEASADRSVLRAKIALNEARRAENELLAKANEEQTTSISLAGLSVDQIKTTLENARATLAAQKARTKAVVKTAKTEQELEDERLTLRLNVLDAEQNLRDVERERGGLTIERNERIEEAEERLAELQRQKEDALIAQEGIQERINSLLAGETTLARALKVIDDQITAGKVALKAAQEGVAEATRAVRDAETEAARQAAIFRGDVDAIYATTLKQIEQMREGAKLDFATNAAYDARLLKLKANNDEIQKTIGLQQNLNKTIGLSPLLQPPPNNSFIQQIDPFTNDLTTQFSPSGGTGGLLGGTGLGSPINNVININADSEEIATIRRILEDILSGRPLGLIPRFAQGGLFDNRGAGVIGRIGEAGLEALLPLTRPARLQDLLQDQRVLSPVLAALGRIQLPAGRQTATPTQAAKLNFPSSGNAVGSSLEEKRQKRLLKEAFVEALKEVGMGKGSGDITIQVAQSTNANQALSDRHTAQEIKRVLNEELGRI